MKRKRIRRIRSATGFVTRLIGLMGRKQWPQAYAGLYFPDCRSVHCFFTFLVLDIVFVDKAGKILKIFPKAARWRVYWGSRGTRGCLELPGGTAKKLGLSEGTTIQF